MIALFLYMPVVFRLVAPFISSCRQQSYLEPVL
jgi:hypothetical protein